FGLVLKLKIRRFAFGSRHDTVLQSLEEYGFVNRWTKLFPLRSCWVGVLTAPVAHQRRDGYARHGLAPLDAKIPRCQLVVGGHERSNSLAYSRLQRRQELGGRAD